MKPKPSIRLRIGELAARTGRSVHTIRWYEAQGLLPAVPRDDGGSRLYSQRHIDWLELMERLRRSGMSVADLRAYTALAQRGGATLQPVRAMLVAHRAQVEEKIAEWQMALQLIDEKIGFYTQWIDKGARPPKAPSKAGLETK
jgi:DNA-binding transcriptional MerR regulator